MSLLLLFNHHRRLGNVVGLITISFLRELLSIELQRMTAQTNSLILDSDPLAFVSAGLSQVGHQAQADYAIDDSWSYIGFVDLDSSWGTTSSISTNFDIVDSESWLSFLAIELQDRLDRVGLITIDSVDSVQKAAKTFAFIDVGLPSAQMNAQMMFSHFPAAIYIEKL